MTEQGSTTAHRGPVPPTPPDVSALAGGGRRRRRVDRLAAAQRSGSASPTNEEASASTTAEPQPQEPPQIPESQKEEGAQRQQDNEVATPLPDAADSSATSEEPPEAPAEAEVTGGKSEGQGAANNVETLNAELQLQTPPDVSGVQKQEDAHRQQGSGNSDSPTFEVNAKATTQASTAAPSEVGETGKAASSADATAFEDASADPVALPKGTELERGDFEETEDQDEGDENANFVGGTHTLQTYVPDIVAKKFQDMQQTGTTAEVIVLTAVRNCADRIPRLVEEARGPVHKEGLFPGLEVLEKKPGRKTKERPNSSRVQYQVRAKFLPDLKRLAGRHELKLSVLVRLALGDFFKEPVRMGRTKR